MGTDKRDFLNGNDGDDVILGLGGRDDLLGGSGDDVIYGRDGNDYLWSKDGDRDKVYGGKGKDRCTFDKLDYVDSSCEQKRTRMPQI